MPATRVTIASNAQQSQRFPLIIPASTPSDPLDPSSIQSLVFKTARSKLRLKKPARVFVARTGQELLAASDWQSLLRDDLTLLVSSGEDYVGAKKDPSSSSAANTSLDAPNPDVRTTVLAGAASVEPLAITQLETTARSLPGILHAVAQPDLHPGTKFPIGAVFVSAGWIHPPLIGSDIGCGMAWYRTALSPSQVAGSSKGARVAENLRGLEGAWRCEADRRIWLSSSSSSSSSPSSEEQKEGSLSVGPAFDASLGTIGAGNHFAELQIVEHVSSSSAARSGSRSLAAGDVLLLVHSGSRGYGGDVLKRHAHSNASLRAGSEEANAYLAEHDAACSWAERNRDLIALRFLSCLEPGDPAWALGLNDRSGDPASPASIRAAHAAVRSRRVVSICHNAVSRALYPSTDPHEQEQQREVFIHRKGAAPVYHPFTASCGKADTTMADEPLDILPLPGSRGTPTLILSPAFSARNRHGALNAYSLAHGAGRAMSRAKAASSLAARHGGRADEVLRGDYVPLTKSGAKLRDAPPRHRGAATETAAAAAASAGNEDVGDQEKAKKGSAEEEGEKEEKKGRAVRGGTWVVCEDRQLVWEEAPEAYKDVWDVAKDLVDAGAAERVGWCRGVVSYKVRKE